METKKINIDVLTKTMSPKELKNVLGGSDPIGGGGSGSCCDWCCTIDAKGTCGEGGTGSSSIDCWAQAEAACTPFTLYGIIVVTYC